MVLEKNIAVDLFPRPNAIRKQQHELINHYHLTGFTVGGGKIVVFEYFLILINQQ